MSKKSIFPYILFALILVCLTAVAVVGRQSTAFTYQGKLTDAGNPANGNYDLQFRLFDALVSGVQVGSTLVRDDVPASNGIFTVTLDFVASAFPGANRWLEVSVRPGASTGAFTSLSPLQPISSTPYAIQSLNAATASGLSSACVGCVTGAQIGSLPTDSGNYIQNSATLQAASNFNISGNGFIGGALGIGTTTPAHALQVNGITSLGGPGGIHGQSIDGPFPGPYPSLSFNTFYNGSSYLAGVAGYAGIFQFQDGDGKFGFYNTGSSVAAGEQHNFIPRLIVLNNGNVGIGTTNPGNGKLHVEGGSSVGVYAFSDSLYGVEGFGGSRGVSGHSGVGIGVYGTSGSGYGVVGDSTSGTGLYARTFSGPNIVEGYQGITRRFHITNTGTYVAGSDFAEALPARGDKAGYEPGDVLVLSTKVLGTVEKTSRTYDERVAGVYSTRPGILGAEKDGATRVDAEDLPVAIIGVVPTKVSAEGGPIQVGDMLTTSSTPGYAMRCEDRVKCLGATLGKAMEPLPEGRGVLKVLVSLR